MKCKHGTVADHTAGARNGRLLWVCSDCGMQAQWSDGWAYHGSMECWACSGPAIERVRCPDCAPGEAVRP